MTIMIYRITIYNCSVIPTFWYDIRLYDGWIFAYNRNGFFVGGNWTEILYVLEIHFYYLFVYHGHFMWITMWINCGYVDKCVDK